MDRDQVKVAGAAFLILYVAVTQIFLWVSYFAYSKRHSPSVYTVNVAIGLAFSIGCLVLLIVKNFPVWLLLVGLLNIMFTLIRDFSYIYWSHGTESNFSQTLSHLDALYFAIGTLGTGTGNIVAISEWAKGIQMIQMVLDIVLVVFVIGMIVARVMSRLEKLK